MSSSLNVFAEKCEPLAETEVAGVLRAETTHSQSLCRRRDVADSEDADQAGHIHHAVQGEFGVL